jgi:hypothetical protein
MGTGFCETSSLTGANIHSSFVEIAKLILHKVETGAASPYKFKSKLGEN